MFLGFGEIMMRVAPPGRRRWRQALPGAVEVTWGGGEANTIASLALLGNPARFVTALPRHPISETLAGSLRGLGVDTDAIHWTDTGRLGIYFVEVGANQRGSTVLYDRAGSAVSLTPAADYDLDQVLDGVTWLHVTGITPAISREAQQANLHLAREAKQRGVTVSCDLNFRKKLWKWEPGTAPRELARRCMPELLEFVDVVIANEEDAADVLDIHAAGTDVHKGQIDAQAYEGVARQIVERFGHLRHVAITLRESISADHNNWGAMLYNAGEQSAYLAPRDADGRYAPYEIRDIVDRVGAGDSFAAGLLHSFAPAHQDKFASDQDRIDFAVAASCLKHSVHGDFNYVTEAEALALAAGNATGRVQR